MKRIKLYWIETTISLISIITSIIGFMNNWGNVCMPVSLFIVVLLLCAAGGWLLAYRQFKLSRKNDIDHFYKPGMRVKIMATNTIVRVIGPHPFKRNCLICQTADGNEVVCHAHELMLII
ncbi:MAG: hypothetical protein HPY79_10500 [Bacteroidales bacterium]|nr:hypothetical protein [Bacteroidales bacterium]